MDHNIISKKEAKENGVNLDCVDYCRQIRNLAQLDRVKLDENIHRTNNANKHLFSYIEYCELDPLQFIKSYLSNLQPYMLEHRSSQEKKDTMVCVIDNAYRISIYIKVDRLKGKELIISFHENINKRGYAKENNTIQNFSALYSEIVPVFGEPMGSRLDGSKKEEIKVFIQRGMLILPVRVMAQKCEGNIYLVERGSIERPIVEECNQYLRDLYSSNVDLEALNNVEIFSVLQQISFTSYGNTIFSNITLLIDNLEIQRGQTSKIAASFALTTYIDYLYLTEDQAEELISLLHEKYSVTSSRNIESIIDRVTDELLSVVDSTEQIIDMEQSAVEVNELIDSHNREVAPEQHNEDVLNVSHRKKGR